MKTITDDCKELGIHRKISSFLGCLVITTNYDARNNFPGARSRLVRVLGKTIYFKTTTL